MARPIFNHGMARAPRFYGRAPTSSVSVRVKWSDLNPSRCSMIDDPPMLAGKVVCASAGAQKGALEARTFEIALVAHGGSRNIVPLEIELRPPFICARGGRRRWRVTRLRKPAIPVHSPGLTNSFSYES